MKTIKILSIFAIMAIVMLCFSSAMSISKYAPIGSGSADIDTELIQNKTGEELETGIPFLVAMIILGAGVGVILDVIRRK